MIMCCVGVPGALDRECWFDSCQQRSDIPPVKDPSWTHPDILHPPDLPLYLREQAHGHHRQGTSQNYTSLPKLIEIWDK